MNNQLTDAEASALTERAFELLTKRLEQFGNILSAPHKKALHGIVEAFSQMTQGELQGRWAVGLAAGLGKSTSVVCWLAALLQHGLQNRVSVAVAAEEVEALCDLWKSLESMGVDMSHVGIKHSKAGARVPSTPDYDQKPILFICHARVRDKYLQQFNTYKGQPRQLLIWDESLIATYSQSCETNILTSIIGSMERLIRRDVDLRHADNVGARLLAVRGGRSGTEGEPGEGGEGNGETGVRHASHGMPPGVAGVSASSCSFAAPAARTGARHGSFPLTPLPSSPIRREGGEGTLTPLPSSLIKGEGREVQHNRVCLLGGG